MTGSRELGNRRLIHGKNRYQSPVLFTFFVFKEARIHHVCACVCVGVYIFDDSFCSSHMKRDVQSHQTFLRGMEAILALGLDALNFKAFKCKSAYS